MEAYDDATESGNLPITSRFFEPPKDAFSNTMNELIRLPPKLTGVAFDMAATEIYERNFGIYSHSPETDPNNPVPLSTYNSKIDARRTNPLRNEVKRLLSMQAPKKLGMGIMDILNLDPHTYASLIEGLESYNKTELAMREQQEEELKEMTGQD